MIYFDEEDYKKAFYSNEDSELFLKMYDLVKKEEKLIRKALQKHSVIKLKNMQGFLYEASDYNDEEDTVLLKFLNSEKEGMVSRVLIRELVMDKLQLAE